MFFHDLLDNHYTMSNFLEAPNRRSYNSSKEENVIREIFYRHWEKMKNQMSRTTDEINRWRLESIEEITKHADQEIKILNDYYNRQRVVFDEHRRVNIETTTSYIQHGAKESELFTQLRDACNTLEFQMATLGTMKITMDLIKVITVEDQTTSKPKNSIIKQGLATDDNTHYDERSSPNSDRINRQTLATGTANNGSIDNQKNHNTKADDSNNKCPICFMIYPLSMSQPDRSLHVNQHYKDDDN